MRHISQIIRWNRQHTGLLKFERLMERLRGVSRSIRETHRSGDEDREQSTFWSGDLQATDRSKSWAWGKWNLAYRYQYPGRLDAQLEINGKTFWLRKTKPIYPREDPPKTWFNTNELVPGSPDLNQLGLKVGKIWNFLVTPKIKITKDFTHWRDQSCIRQTKSVNMGATYFGGLIDTA